MIFADALLRGEEASESIQVSFEVYRSLLKVFFGTRGCAVARCEGARDRNSMNVSFEGLF